MTRQEFQGYVTAVFSSAMNWRGDNGIYWPSGDEHHYERRWIVGGMSGGNCWGDSPNWAVTPEPEPSMDKLDQLLEDVAPNLTVRQYKEILAEVVKEDRHTEHEYYGNYTHWASKRLEFDQLYQALKSRGVI